jgi:hypothetical protein
LILLRIRSNGRRFGSASPLDLAERYCYDIVNVNKKKKRVGEDLQCIVAKIQWERSTLDKLKSSRRNACLNNALFKKCMPKQRDNT